MLKTLTLAFFCATFVFLTGCMDITGRGKAPLGQTIGAAAAECPRVGHVYCMRGWLGIFSTGMDALAQKIDTQVGAPAVSVADEEWRWLKVWLVDEEKKGAVASPLVLVGHSWALDDQIRVAEYLQQRHITVDLLVLIDPVTPPAVPTNVKRVYCIYKSHPMTDWYPAWRGVPAAVVDPKMTELTNINLRTADLGVDTSDIDHINIEKSPVVHKMVMAQIEKVCPLRADWAKGHSLNSPVTQLPTAKNSAQ